MAINKLMMRALKALSYTEIDVKKNYKLDRKLDLLIHPPIKRPFSVWDQNVEINGHTLETRIFLPEEEKSHEILLFFHGGGWVKGDIDGYTVACQTLADTSGRRVLALDYRLAPEHPFPAAPEDCYTLTKRLMQNTDYFGITPDDVVLIGDSAGANLAAVVSLMARDRGDFAVRRQILLYPCTASDHSDEGGFPSIAENGRDYLLTSKRIRDYIELYLTSPEDYENPYFAPLCADLSDQPDTLVLTAEYDPLRDEGEAFAEKLREYGNNAEYFRIPDALHGFFNLPNIFDETKLCHEKIREFLECGITDR